MGLLPGMLAAQVPAPAAGGEVEIIVFRHRDPRGSTAETPPPAAVAAAATLSEPVAPAAPAGIEPAPLPAGALRLGALVARLRQAGVYELLYHGGWTQAIVAQDSALPTALPAEGRLPGLDGTVTIYQERFLHVLLDLQLAAGAEAGLQPARIRQGRRLRGQGLHYFDHPRFGVILAVRPGNAPAPAP